MSHPYFLYQYDLPYNKFIDLVYSLQNHNYDGHNDTDTTNITHLAFNCCNINDSGIEILCEYNRHVTHLSLQCCGKITEAGVKALARDSLLEDLKLNSCYFGDSGIVHLGASKTLKALSVMYCNITPTGFIDFSINKTILELSLRGNTIDENAAKALRQMEQLRILSVDACKLNDDSVYHLCRLPNLEELNLSDNAITGQGILPLLHNDKIKTLYVNWTPIGDNGIWIICTMKELNYLEAHSCRCSTVGAKLLAVNQSIKCLDIMYNEIDFEGVKAILTESNGIKQLNIIRNNIPWTSMDLLVPLINANTSILYIHCDEPIQSAVNRLAPPYSEYRRKYSWDISMIRGSREIHEYLK